MNTPQSDQEMQDFSPALLSAVTHPPSPLPRIMMYVLFVLIGFVVVWSIFGRLDIVARAQGKLIPQTRLKIVQPLEGGRVSKIMVKDGELVKKGQLLMLMDTHLTEADSNKLNADLVASKLQLRRIKAEITGAEMIAEPGDNEQVFRHVSEQYRAHRAEYLHSLGLLDASLKQFQSELDIEKEIHEKLRQTLPIHQQNEAAIAKLGEKGYISKIDILESKRKRIEAERDLQAQKYALISIGSKINEAKEKVSQLKSNYRQQLFDQRIELTNRINQLEQDWNKQQYRNELMELKAPTDGFVKDLTTNTEGSIVPAGTVLMNVVPVDEPLQAEVYVDNKDIGFIHAGQEVKLKLMSYEFQKYGMIDAAVEYVSADANDRAAGAQGVNSDAGQSLGYRTIIALNNQLLERNGKKYLLRPGMQVTAEIKIGSRTVLDYILSPVQKALHEAGTER